MGDVFKVELSGNGWSCELGLPATREQLDQALEEIGAASWEEVTFFEMDSAIPGILEDLDCDGIHQANRLARLVKELERRNELPKLKAVLIATDCREVSTAIEIAEKLDEYILEPDTRTEEDVARAELRVVVDDRSAEILLPHLDLLNYGRDLIKLHNSEITPYGLVERVDGQPLQINEPRQGGMEMM